MSALRIAAALAFSMLGAGPALADGLGVGDRAREVVGREIWSDKVISTEDYLGRWLLVDFFATWCGPCMHELPNLVAATRDLRGDSFEVMAISVDTPHTEGKLRPTLREHGAHYPCIYQGGGWQTPPVTEWGVRGIPAIYLINPQGVIVATGLRGEELRPALEYFIQHGEEVPPISISLTGSEVQAGQPLKLQLELVNPQRSPLDFEIDSVEYAPVYADDDPEGQGDPIDYRELSSNPDGSEFSITVDTDDWGMGGAEIELPYEAESHYFSADYRVRLPGSVSPEHPDGIWLSGYYFAELPACKAALAATDN